MVMLFLLMALSDWASPDNHQFVTVGRGFWCDQEPQAINQVINEFPQVAITSQEVWPPLEIQKSVSITGGFESCLEAKLGKQPVGFSLFKGTDTLPVISINGSAKTAANVTLKHLTIESGSAPNGAGILANGHYRLILDEVLIQNNHAQYLGGGLSLNGQANSLILKNTVIRNNHAQQGAGLAIEGFGHLITLDHSKIQQNKSQISGGGIFCNGLNLIQFQDSQISDNMADWGQDLDADIRCSTQTGKSHFKLERLE
jgi:hypothetical protein